MTSPSRSLTLSFISSRHRSTRPGSRSSQRLLGDVVPGQPPRPLPTLAADWRSGSGRHREEEPGGASAPRKRTRRGGNVGCLEQARQKCGGLSGGQRGAMSMLKLQGALLRGTESLRVGLRSYSLTEMKEEARKKLLWEQVELVEVLEARVKQLQADTGPEALVERVFVSGLRRGAGQPAAPLPKAWVPKKPAPKDDDRGVTPPSRWMEKLHRERLVKRKQLEELQTGLRWRDSSGAKAKPSRSPPKESDDLPPALKMGPGQTKGKRLPSSASEEGLAPAKPALGHREEVEARPEQPPAPAEAKGDENFRLSLLAYLETCVFLRQLDRAQRCLAFYHHRRQKVLDLRMYNLVMHGQAKQGALRQVASVFRMLDEVGLDPNPDSYVAVLSCMGRSETHPDLIERCLAQLRNDGYSLEGLFPEGLYQEDEVEMALKAIRVIVPDFQPPRPPRRTGACTIPLLQDFYAQRNCVSYPKLDFTAQDLRERFQQQLALETSGTINIQSVQKTPVTERIVQARMLLDTLRSRWKADLLRSFQKSKLHMEMKKTNQINLYPFFCVIPEKEYVDIMMQMLSTLPPVGESLTTIAHELGNKIYARYLIQKKIHSRLLGKIESIYGRYVQLLAKDTKPDNFLPREYWEKVGAEVGCDLALVGQGYLWPTQVLVQLGIHLVELLVQVLKVESNLLMPKAEKKLIPALYHVYSFRGTWQVGFLRLHPIVLRLSSEAADTGLAFDASVLPMLCPPVPWISAQAGAYLASSALLIRLLDGAAHRQQVLRQCSRPRLGAVFDALNQLGNCPWQVNGPILDLVVAIFNDKGNVKLGVPPPPSEAPRPPQGLPEGRGPLTKAELKREHAQWRKRAAETYSQRMDVLYKLSIASHFRGRVFWFPHNLDFRGRTYPCPPHFNHLGGDLTRALLLLGEGRPLGPRGLDWLKIHLVNLTGLKKRSPLAERLAYANQILDDILDSADRPLTGRKWWMGMEEPWQVLACSMEIANAVRSPDPAAYISHFPVHQDGSCNGLQHYAALGRDVIGAASVNLLPDDVPQDVYSVVAQRVELFRKQDAECGIRVAEILEGFISRKVVKQTVMTVVYGVTRYGGRLQIEKRLKEMDSFPQKYTWEASHYLVKQVFDSLREMFTGTREIQAWLTECATLIAKSGQVVEWVTPLGLPVIQPYRRSKSLTLKTKMQAVNLKFSCDTNQKPNTMKQKNAFPPNFIHSLDSTHMMLTALHCHRLGLTFASVHDCYWTHAAMVDIMNRVCREQFVRLHQQPILEDLSQFMLKKYCAGSLMNTTNKNSGLREKLMERLSDIPPKGDFDLQKVKDSTYFFS
ncbi:DNA-directed RNA polymerase, mitochondrial [Pogona vitticeps]